MLAFLREHHGLAAHELHGNLDRYDAQIRLADAELGRLFASVEGRPLDGETLWIVTSDHGEGMGNHGYAGHGRYLYEEQLRVPLLLHGGPELAPRVVSDMVRLVDVLPTVAELCDLAWEPERLRLEGRSLQPLLHGQASTDWRDAVFSEIDYAFYAARETLDVDVSDARGYMLRTERWKYIHFRHFPPQLFDLESDSDEFQDLGRDAGHEAIRQSLHAQLLDRLTARKNRVTMTDEGVRAMRGDEDSAGIIIGKWG